MFSNEEILNLEDDQLRKLLVIVSLEWQRRFSIAPSITSTISEYDAAKLVGSSLHIGAGRSTFDTAVTKGFDFRKNNLRYQVKANRPSGKPGSKVTIVGKARTFNWDYLIWILYNTNFEIEEAWEFSCSKYIELFEEKKRLCPNDMRKGKRLK